MSDWISDPDLSREEKLARFESLAPEPTKAPDEVRGALLQYATVLCKADHTFALSHFITMERAGAFTPRIAHGGATSGRSVHATA